MARTGLYKSDVKKARDALLAQNRHPSVDAVRIALGNTGSKTTIHKYLRELEEEEGSAAADSKASISDALQDLVARLATQLQDEADQRIEAMQAQCAAQERSHADALQARQKDIEALTLQLRQAESEFGEEKTAHERTRTALQQETIVRHTAEQQVADLKERLAENEAHRHSLEDKHRHAREALEHYRQSVKEQRDQDQRRHEQQVQQLQAEQRQLQQSLVVKQDEVTRLNREGVRLVAELSHAQQALHEEQDHARHLAQRLEALQGVEQHCKALEAQAADRNAQIQSLQDQLAAREKQAQGLAAHKRELELALAAAHAKLEAQQGLVAELRAYLDSRSLPAAADAVTGTAKD